MEKAAVELGFVFSGIETPVNDKSHYGIRYAEFVVPLVKAVQELAEENDELKKQNQKLANRLEIIESKLNLK